MNTPYYWHRNIERIYQVSRQCTSRSEFQKKFKGAYAASIRLGIYDDVCSHMVLKGRGSKRCIYIIEFPKKVCYIGLTNDFERRKYEHNTFVDTTIDLYKKKSNENFEMTKLTDYLPESQSIEMEELYKQKYEIDGYLILNRKPTGGLGGSYIIHTLNTILEEAKNFTSQIEFITKKRNLYECARHNGWLDQVCSHMRKKKNSWNIDEIILIASSYDSIWDFGKNNRNAYEWARNHKLLNEIKKIWSLKNT